MQALRLVGTLRGAGALLSGSLKIDVTYAIDLYRRQQMRLASGGVDGRMSARLKGVKSARLELADGQIVSVGLRDIGAGFATFDAEQAGAAVCHAVWSALSAPEPPSP